MHAGKIFDEELTDIYFILLMPFLTSLDFLFAVQVGHAGMQI
jgi:hypothetical protein